MLQAAAYNGEHILIQLLTGKEVNLDVQSDVFEDALQIGCIKGYMAVVEQLICRSANPNREDEHGWTPLLCASWFGQGQILDYLLSNGGDTDLLSHVNTIPPDSWSRIYKSTSLQLDENSICVRYGGKLKICIFKFKFHLTQPFVKHIDDTRTGQPLPALILANHPVPLQNDSFYFEIEILNSGDTG